MNLAHANLNRNFSPFRLLLMINTLIKKLQIHHTTHLHNSSSEQETKALYFPYSWCRTENFKHYHISLRHFIRMFLWIVTCFSSHTSQIGQWRMVRVLPLSSSCHLQKSICTPNTLLGLSLAHHRVVQGVFMVSYTVIYWTLHLKHTQGLNLQKKSYN